MVGNLRLHAEGWHSLLDSDHAIEFTHHRSATALLTGLESHWPVARLQWFTKGFYSVRSEGRDVVITDLRMGQEPQYVFRHTVAQRGNPHWEPIETRLFFSSMTPIAMPFR